MNTLKSKIKLIIFLCVLSLSVGVMASDHNGQSSFTLFESGQVRPLALSSDGKTLFAVNTPDNRLEFFRVKKDGLKHQGSVSVGLEPVSVAVRNNNEVWVVNHLSDSISILKSGKPLDWRVVRTLFVGDEPRDVVFAGAENNRAFITTAHRGQNVPFDPQFTTPGVGRADVWAFDANYSGSVFGGAPLSIVTLFGDTPRALAVSPDGSRVYAAVFQSGNKTTTLFEESVTYSLGLPAPLTNFEGNPQPPTGLIVQYDGNKWVDNVGRDWSSHVKFSLPDKDVFVIDADANPPVQISGDDGYFQGVGTTIFNMITNPVNGAVYVANTGANNLTRFEGPGEFGGSTVRGHIHESHITVLMPDGTVMSRHLNKHIDYASCCAAIPNEENARSLALPMDMAITQDGETLYVAAFGSSKIGVFETAEIEDDTFTPSTDHQIDVAGGGPSGIVLDEANERLYVLARFDNSISVIDTVDNNEIDHLPMFNPEPASIVIGRHFLYDASLTSSHGDTACASCHVFADLDSLAWDLGDPETTVINNPGPFTIHPLQVGFPDNSAFQPNKGPMTTQSLRGMANHGPMHWRGDRTGGNDEATSQPDGGTFNEEQAFKKFQVAFHGLNGAAGPLTGVQMQAFTDFILQIMYPPNPIRALDNSLTPDQSAGRELYFGDNSDTFFNCNGCHVLDPDGNKEFAVAKPGFFGTDGKSSFEFETQVFKIPHLRNLYQKVGKFGQEGIFQLPTGLAPFFLPSTLIDNDNGHKGDQIRGFGFMHDGNTDTLFRFMGSSVFAHRPIEHPFPNTGGFTFDLSGIIKRRQVEQFMLAYDSNLAPIVGQQVTLNGHYNYEASSRLDLLIARAEMGECDLVAKTRMGNREAGYLYLGDGSFDLDKKGPPPISDTRLRGLANRSSGEITYTCVPPGSGVRIALDRDEDGVFNGNE